MPSLQEMSHVGKEEGKRRAGRSGPPRDPVAWPDITTPANLEAAAALVHWEMLERAKRQKNREQKGGVGGWIWVGTRAAVFHYLWRGLKEEDRTNRRGSLTPGQIAEKKISQFLNARGNTICLKHGGHGKNGIVPSTWWVRDEFLTGRPSATDIRRYLAKEPDWFEQKVTPEEAGENREPEPVTIRHQPPTSPAREHYGLRKLPAGGSGRSFSEVPDMPMHASPAGKERVLIRADDGTVWLATLTDLDI